MVLLTHSGVPSPWLYHLHWPSRPALGLQITRGTRPPSACSHFCLFCTSQTIWTAPALRMQPLGCDGTWASVTLSPVLLLVFSSLAMLRCRFPVHCSWNAGVHAE